MKISIIGAGNVASHLAPALARAKYEVVTIYSRNLANAEAISRGIEGCQATDSLDFSQNQADMFLLCLADQAHAEILPKLLLPSGSKLAHTSGTQSLESLQTAKNIAAYGVFYPLQTFSKNKVVDFSLIPFCIEASTPEFSQELSQIARELSYSVQLVDSEARKVLHVAAVIACNFANHLWAVSEEVLQKAKLDFEILHPLLSETLAKALQHSPKTVQTGPAKRRDLHVIEAQREYLQSIAKPAQAEIYHLLSQSIMAMYQAPQE